MTEPNPFRGEIEQILIDHPRTRYAKVLLGMRRGLSDAEMSKEALEAGEPINAESIAHVRKLVRLTLDDELMPAPSDAADQAIDAVEGQNHCLSDCGRPRPRSALFG